MGDDELNFTEEETRCWADDPYNQAPPAESALRPFAVFVLALIAIVTVLWVASSSVPEQQAAQPGSGAVSHLVR
jgi:hypothetical protein